MDEQSGDSQTSSMVDYVFFVLQQSSQRAVEAHNIYGLCATVNHIIKCLDNYKEVFFPIPLSYSQVLLSVRSLIYHKVLIKIFKDQAAKAVLGRANENKNTHLVWICLFLRRN